MPKALLTGSSGFVGRHFQQFLDGVGWDTTCIDITDGNDARVFFRRVTERFDLVVHCAAVVGGRQTIDNNALSQAVNLELDSGLFQWALRNKPKRVLYFSSSAAYPVWMQGNDLMMTGAYRLKESDIDHTLQDAGMPDQLYGWAKLTGENLAHRYRQAGGHVSVVRPFSGYGEDQSTDYPFPSFIYRALGHDNPFKVWGDGTQTRDFIHIDDIVKACWAMVQMEINGPVNLGTGRPTTMTHLARLVQAASGFCAPIKYETSAPRGVSYRVADVTRLNDFYKPKISLEEGIKRAINCRKL